MADFVKEIGTMLQSAMRADVTLRTVVGKTGSTWHIEYSDQPISFPAGATGRAYVRFSGQDREADFGESALTAFKYVAVFDCVDVRGKKAALSKVAMGMNNAFANNGRAALLTHLVDSGSNWLGSSGEIKFTFEVNARESVPDLDRPVVAVEFTVRITHKIPLV